VGDGVVDVRDEFGAFAGEVVAPAKQVAGSAHPGGIDIRQWQESAAEEAGDLRSTDAVILGVSAVSGMALTGPSRADYAKAVNNPVRIPNWTHRRSHEK